MKKEERVIETKPMYPVRQIRDLKDMLNQTLTLFGDRYAFEIKKSGVAETVKLTYKDYLHDINALGTALLNMGYKNKNIAILSDNRYEWCLSYMATVCGVGIVVPIDKELLFNDINDILVRAEISMIFCDKRALAKLSGGKIPDGVVVVCFDKDEDDEQALSFTKIVEAGAALVEQGDRHYIDAEIDPEKMCTLLFTSGTTGLSKGVMLCHRNFCFEVMSAMSVLKIYPEDCGISLLPLHHTFESSIMVFFAPYCGAKVTFCEGFKYVLKNMKEFNPSVFVAVPLLLETVHRRILKEIKKKKNGEALFKIGKKICLFGSKVGLDFSKVFFKEIQQTFGGNMRLIICGGAPIDPQILEDFKAFGIQILFGYGLTECAPLAIINNDRLHLTKSFGEPLPGTQAKILDPDENGIGEICVKGGMVMLGYYQNQAATDAVIDEDGFFHTGDLGYADKDGHFYMAGRCKNVIVTANGKNIYPEELEYHLSLNPIVGEAMVYEDTDDKGQPIVKASIYPNDEEICAALGKDSISEEDREKAVKSAVSEVNEKMPSFKHIRSVSVRQKEFIKSTSQKILRHRKENRGTGEEE
ncbi:MAG TPA: AMP-dependent synthetase [Ruminococcaceae bacterium]|nr:AMP-dependent synthetase [Oscillospiraceae bacterium]